MRLMCRQGILHPGEFLDLPSITVLLRSPYPQPELGAQDEGIGGQPPVCRVEQSAGSVDL